MRKPNGGVSSLLSAGPQMGHVLMPSPVPPRALDSRFQALWLGTVSGDTSTTSKAGPSGWKNELVTRTHRIPMNSGGPGLGVQPCLRLTQLALAADEHVSTHRRVLRNYAAMHANLAPDPACRF